MITSLSQRWRDRRGSYRVPGETIDTRRYEVAALASDAIARAFVETHHYEGSYPAAKHRFGLYRGAALVGVGVWGVPVNEATLDALPGEGDERGLLSRVVLLDGSEGVPHNGESWFLARAFELLRRAGMASFVTFSDPEPRTSAAGDVTFVGHIGTIYQASNAVYVGRARKDTQRLLPDGSILHCRAIAKLKKRDRGWTTAHAQLVAAGAMPMRPTEDAAAWAERWIPRLTRKRRHPGNHKYLFGLTPAARRALPAGQDYPKFDGESRMAS